MKIKSIFLVCFCIFCLSLTGCHLPENPNNTSTSENAITCSITIDASDILTHLDTFNPEKQEFLPEDGIIYTADEVSVSDGLNALDMLLQTAAEQKIHTDTETSPIYQSTYIQGINNIYEKDCGEMSGWTYQVNGESPSVSADQYTLKDGDRVEWIYSCDLSAGM